LNFSCEFASASRDGNTGDTIVGSSGPLRHAPSARVAPPLIRSSEVDRRVFAAIAGRDPEEDPKKKAANRVGSPQESKKSV